MIQLFIDNQAAIYKAFNQTAIMMGISLSFTVLLGLPLGILLVISRKDGIKPNFLISTVANIYVNAVRSFPYILFVVFMMPVTRFLLGFTLGTIPASFPLSLVGIAIYARYVEQSLLEIHSGLDDTSLTMGASTLQTVWHFYLVESRASLIRGFTASTISLLSYSTVMGIVSGGGLGDFAMIYGYHQHRYDLMMIVVVMIIVIVQILQWLGHALANQCDKH